MDFELNLQTETIAEVYSSEPICVPADSTAAEVLQRMRAVPTGSALVCDQERLVGIFTERDALRLLAAGSKMDWQQPIRSVMVPNPVTLTMGDSVGEAIAKMSSGGYRRLPVVDAEGRPVGVVKTSGILHYLVQHFPQVIYNLPPTPHHITRDREGA